MQTIDDGRYVTLACAQSLRYLAGRISGTSSGTGLRAQLDTETRAAWEGGRLEDKNYKIASKVGPLGTYHIATTGGETITQSAVTDLDTLLKWLRSPAGEQALVALAYTAPDLIRAAARTTGETPPGIAERVVTTPEEFKNTTLNCTVDTANRAAQLFPELRGAVDWLQRQQ